MSQVASAPASTGLALVHRERVFAEYWTHPGDDNETDNHKKSCVPKCLSPTVYPLTTYLEPMYSVERAKEDSVALHLSFLFLSMLTCSSTKEERL
jgi:hypothetical protein